MPLFGSSSKGKFECRVLFLDNNEQRYQISNKTFGDELLSRVFTGLDLYEKEYFGLRYKDRYGDVHWLDPNKTVKKQILGFDSTDCTLYFGVKFYAADPTKLREEITRYQFFLQVKKDVLQGRIPCEEKTAAELCAYCVQSELGDYDPSLHTDGFISEFRFVPQQTPGLEDQIADTYKELRGLMPSEAELKFLERVKWLEMYGVELHPVKGQDNMDYLLGLTPTGIVLFKNKNKIGSFIWPKITKLKYKGTCFLLRATQGRNDEEKEYTFICNTKDKAKNLWKNCAEHHTFFRLEKANDVPASAYNFLFRKGSGFKFSGRTQQELENDVDRRPRSQPEIHRKPSQRYNRRSQNSEGNSERDLTDGPRSPISNASTISAPWEATFANQSGLYSNGQRNSFPNRPGSSNTDRTSPKHHRKSGYNSSGDAENKRRRSHYYSGYTSASDMESGRIKSSNKYGSAPNIQHKMHLHQPQPNGHQTPHYFHEDPNARHHRHHSKESLHMLPHGMPHMMGTPNGYDPRRYRPSGSKSDGEETNRERRRQHYHHHRHNGSTTDNEMVAPLDVYHNTMGVALEEHRQRRYRHHHSQQRSHRHNRHKFDPSSAEVLLELGPDSASRDGLSSGTDNQSGTPLSSDKENVNPTNATQLYRHNYPPPHDPSYGMHYPHGMPVGVPGHSPQRYLPQYLPSHLLKQGRPPMMNMHAGGMQPMYRPHYVEQSFFGRPHSIHPPFTRSHSLKHLRNTPSNDNRYKSTRTRPKPSNDEWSTTK